jgi:hypothetical protein
MLTGNIVGAAMQIVSLFGDQGPSPEQLILEQLPQLRQQIAELRVELHERFDRIDTALNQIYDTLVQRFDRIDWRLGRLNGKVEEILTALFGLQADLNRVQRNIYAFLEDGFRMELREAINGCLRYRERAGVDMPYQLMFLNGCENVFQTWATEHAANQLYAGPDVRDFRDSALFTELEFPLAFNINYFAAFPAQVLGLLPLSFSRLPNPLDLAMATEAWLRLARENPQHMRRLAPARLTEIAQTTRTLRTALKQIPKPALVDALLQKYDTHVAAVQDTINTMEEDYRLQYDNPVEPLNLWGDANQRIPHTPVVSQAIDACNGSPLGLSLPANWEQLFVAPAPNPYRLADFLALGQMGLCAGGLVGRHLRHTARRHWLLVWLGETCQAAAPDAFNIPGAGGVLP